MKCTAVPRSTSRLVVVVATAAWVVTEVLVNVGEEAEKLLQTVVPHVAGFISLWTSSSQRLATSNTVVSPLLHRST